MSAPFRNPVADRRAYLSLAWLQRRLAREYRAWAAGPGTPERLAKYAADAQRYAKDARWHFHRALST